MGDILSKLQMVSEKIGVTETAHTIEEQVDLISESLDKIPASTNIAEALDDLSEVAQNINNEEVYVDKTITENGEYLPAQDEATAYSKVVANVPPGFNKWTLGYDTTIVHSNNGIYDISSLTNQTIILSEPVVKIINTGSNPVGIMTIKFTPAENFDNIYAGDTVYPETYTGDTITNGDGKIYYFNRNISTGNTVEKKTNNFNITIT